MGRGCKVDPWYTLAPRVGPNPTHCNGHIQIYNELSMRGSDTFWSVVGGTGWEDFLPVACSYLVISFLDLCKTRASRMFPIIPNAFVNKSCPILQSSVGSSYQKRYQFESKLESSENKSVIAGSDIPRLTASRSVCAEDLVSRKPERKKVRTS